MWLFKLILIVVAVSAALLVLIYFAQTRLLFPTQMAEMYRPVLPPSAVRLAIGTGDGARLAGVHIPSASPSSEVILGFGGNAWNADSLAEYLHDLYPHAAVVTFHYRGYRPSSGRPSAAALRADAPVAYDHVVEALGYRRVVAVGLSIGSGVAASLAAERPLAGLILVSPFDSLAALAGEHYPRTPVGLLLRHRIDTAEYLAGTTAPTAVIAAANDTIVPPRRTEAVRLAVRNLILDRTVAGADHNDIYERHAFREAMAEAMARIRAADAAANEAPRHFP